jgi:hypothetical protein
MTETMTPLSRALFSLEREANRLNVELRALPTASPDIKAIFELRDYLSLIARKAAYVASCLNVAAEQQKAKEAA